MHVYRGGEKKVGTVNGMRNKMAAFANLYVIDLGVLLEYNT